MLGALILPIGLGIAGYDFLQRGSIPLGGECRDSEHCANSGKCLEGSEGGICVISCIGGCPDGFVCQQVEVTYTTTQRKAIDMGAMEYCFPANDPAKDNSHE